MGMPVLILGASGAGKSTSLRNFEPTEVGVFNVAGKPLPFRKKMSYVNNNATYETITASLQKNTLNCYVIDDAQYLMAFEFFDRAKETGFAKFADLGNHFYNLLKFIRLWTRDETIVYLLAHTDVEDSGYVKMKTLGRMLDEKLCVEGLFSVVLLAETNGKEHWFTTQSNGLTTAKSPMEMFAPKIDNDLKAVDTAIREYYGFNEEAKKNEKV